MRTPGVGCAGVRHRRPHRAGFLEASHVPNFSLVFTWRVKTFLFFLSFQLKCLWWENKTNCKKTKNEVLYKVELLGIVYFQVLDFTPQPCTYSQFKLTWSHANRVPSGFSNTRWVEPVVWPLLTNRFPMEWDSTGYRKFEWTLNHHQPSSYRQNCGDRAE